jgi:hypothetical protein
LASKDSTKRGVYAPKGYRISRFYELLFESVFNVLGKEKLNLTYALLQNKKTIDIEQIKSLPTLNKNELFELMVDSLREKNEDIKTLYPSFQNERIIELRKIAENTPITVQTIRKLIYFRILPDYVEFISTFSENKYLADAIELVVAHFVMEQPEFEYDLILDVFTYLTAEELKKTT